ncbi:MAG: universal stress protein [Steroidobacteraceae bacterium]|jgi:nucleotide-binding universal stress UspA family protein|nr:universal stress protein [Steroidobacteraceae bacterium]MBP9129149.1 universal stress protein [Steroidobacteraceae bacterium]
MRRILVAIDGSETALRALDFAVQQARCAPPAELQVLNVQPLLSNYTAAEIYVTAERIHQVAAERARAILDAAAEQLRNAGCDFKLEQTEGDPAETIANRATELDCESITMGTHGLSSFGILFMGSVAQRVVHYATVPVTLVK